MSRTENNTTKSLPKQDIEQERYTRFSSLSTFQGLQRPSYIGRSIRTDGTLPQHIGVQRHDNDDVGKSERRKKSSDKKDSGEN